MEEDAATAAVAFVHATDLQAQPAEREVEAMWKAAADADAALAADAVRKAAAEVEAGRRAVSCGKEGGSLGFEGLN